MTPTPTTITVHTSDLHPHNDNPNRGDVEAIAQSLQQFGQYRTIVAAHIDGATDLTILAGHHVWHAARQLDWPELRVDVLDVDAATAKRILLADNRLPELGEGLDPEQLLAVLETLDPADLDGTGYDQAYLDMLQDLTPPALDDLADEYGDPQDGDNNSTIKLSVDPQLAHQWNDHRRGFDTDTEALEYLMDNHG